MPLIRNKRELEGYLRIDHRDSPGLTPEEASAVGRSGIAPFVAAGKMFEGATYTCSHCTRTVVINPDRVRPRAYCPKCDHHICDWCEGQRVASGGACKPFTQIIDEVVDATAKGKLIV